MDKPEEKAEQMEIQEGSRLDNLVENDTVEPENDAPVEAPVETDTELTPEALEGEAAPEVAPVETEPEIVPYTPEEVEALLREDDDANVDFRRLSPEGQAIFKSVDRGLKPKLEERKELLRKQAEIERTVGARESEQPTIEQAFEKNPQGVLANIRQMIAEKEQTDPFGTEVSQLRNAHSYFLEKLTLGQVEESKAATTRAEAYGVVVEAIPDFETKKFEITDFAVKELGISQEDLLRETDAAVVGPERALLTVQVLSRLYDAEKALAKASKGKTIEKKEVKTPTQVESAGEGFQEKPPTEWSDKQQMDELMKQTLT